MVCAHQSGIEMAVSTSSSSGEGRGAEIVFFDLETTGANGAGNKFWVLEFGAIVVCPRKLVELESFCTLIRPRDLSVVRLKSGRSDGITRKAVATAPTFEDVADKIFSILNGRVWAGHNIQRFDCARIKEAFADIGRPAPVPVGMIDSLGVLSQKFGKRAGDMKMATLAAYFGLGQQKHRSLEDVRMNLEVLKHCATVLFLESTLPAVLVNNSQGSSTVVTRSRSNGQLLHGLETSTKPPHTPLEYPKAVPYVRMSERIKNLMCKAQNEPPLTNFLKHSHSLLR
ncbi:protein NEN4-like [Telopea speciosissima]|uniref:protein NEN4-like n=1 Tax=Telopea speciosissima TaxID=54955 RepID=UPI001CC67782|nr:protein NEN4-like [Telopea speciosissima]